MGTPGETALHRTQPLDLPTLAGDQDHLRANLHAYIQVIGVVDAVNPQPALLLLDIAGMLWIGAPMAAVYVIKQIRAGFVVSFRHQTFPLRPQVLGVLSPQIINHCLAMDLDVSAQQIGQRVGVAGHEVD